MRTAALSLACAAALAATASVAAQTKPGPVLIKMADEPIDLSKALEKFPGILAGFSEEFGAPKPKSTKTIYFPDEKDHIQNPRDLFTQVRFITDQFPPVVVTPQGVLKSTLVGADKFIDGLAPAQRSTIERATSSVGRIEIKKADGTYEHIGTGFIAESRHVLTNCHVMQEFATNTNGSWTINPNEKVYIDFSADATHSPADEFLIGAPAKFPATPGFDAAILSVAPRSADASRTLPPDLGLRKTRGTSKYVGDEIFVIGYPALAGFPASPITKNPFGKLSIQKVSKVASPGVLAGINDKHGVDVLLHLASTYKGQSGSPVIEKTEGQVVGIHSCCTAQAAPNAVFTVAQLPCSSMLFADKENQAIATWTMDQVRAPVSAPAPLLTRPRR